MTRQITVSTCILALFFFAFASLYAQSTGFNYQAVARDATTGDILGSETVNLRFILREGSAAGPLLYEETHAETTNDFGLMNLIIGQGTPVSGDFSTIAWGAEEVFMEVQLNGVSISNDALQSVPYAKTATDMPLADLQDVSDAAPASGDVLQWNGSVWAPNAGSTSPWNTSGANIYYDAGRVFVGRSTSITGSEYFGIRTPTGSGSYGGMYVETQDANGWPFYGFATDGNARAWTYWRGTDSTYRLYNNGERLAVTRDGKYGFETTTPEADIHLRHKVITSAATQSGLIGLKIENSGANGHDWTFYVQNSLADLYLYYETTARGRFDDVDGAYSTISDARLKTQVEELSSVLENVLSLPVRSYRYIHQKPEDASRSIGFFAQDVRARFPELVSGTEVDGGEGPHMINYAGFAPIAVKAIQEQQERIMDLEAQIHAQQSENEALRLRLEKLEQLLTKE